MGKGWFGFQISRPWKASLRWHWVICEESEGDSHAVIWGKSLLGTSNRKPRGPEAGGSLPGSFKEPATSFFGWSSKSNRESRKT